MIDPRREHTAQLPLALRYPPDQRFDTFVECDGDTALAQVAAIASGSLRGPVLLQGAATSGKTHLALAACAAAEADGRRCAFLPLAAARGRARDALAALHDNALVALDGLEALAGERDDELALFDFHNRMHDAGHALLYTSRHAPDELPLALPDLRSRLSQCVRVVLPLLDDGGRRELLQRRASRRGLAIEDAAIDWLLARVDRDAGSLARLLDRLDEASLVAKRRVTVPFLRDVLGKEPRG